MSQAVRDTPGPAPSRAWAAELLPLTRRDWIGVAALTLAFWAAGVAGFQFAVGPGVGTAFWPAAGITLAAFCLGGVRLWPGVVIGRILAAYSVDAPQPLWALVLLGLAAALAAALPAMQMRRMRAPLDLNSLQAMLWLVASGAIGGATVSAGLGVIVLAILGAPAETLPHVGVNWWFGYATGALTLTPLLLVWRPGAARPLKPRELAHFAAVLTSVAVLSYVIFLRPDLEPKRAWFIFPVLVWAALAFSLRGASVALLITAGVAFFGAVTGTSRIGGLLSQGSEVLLCQQFVAIMSASVLILAAVADERRNQARLMASEQRLRAETEALELLNTTGAAIAAELDLDKAVQIVTDTGVSLTGAEFGAFFYNVLDEAGESYMLYSLSGVPRSAFERFPMPRNTDVFRPTFEGEGVVRSDDITKDPRYGHMEPHHGMPKGHLPVCSYLAVSVKSRSGEVIGGLFFGHSQPARFDERHERLLVGVAAQAATAIDNARLYQSAQREIAERKRAEAHQGLLINELNHRVKNTLATMQSVGAQTLRSSRDLGEARVAFDARLMALSAAHNLLTDEKWEGAGLLDVVRTATRPFEAAEGGRFVVDGRNIRLRASRALAMAMALHELATNAVKYGALSVEGGQVAVRWRREGEGLQFTWTETGGPAVERPRRKGFGSRLIQDGLARELGGQVEMSFRPEGLVCAMSFPVDAPGRFAAAVAEEAAPEPAE